MQGVILLLCAVVVLTQRIGNGCHRRHGVVHYRLQRNYLSLICVIVLTSRFRL